MGISTRGNPPPRKTLGFQRTRFSNELMSTTNICCSIFKTLPFPSTRGRRRFTVDTAEIQKTYCRAAASSNPPTVPTRSHSRLLIVFFPSKSLQTRHRDIKNNSIAGDRRLHTLLQQQAAQTMRRSSALCCCEK